MVITRATRLFVVEQSAATANVHVTVGELIDAVKEELKRDLLNDLSAEKTVRPT
jgi:hypothetical protein